MGAVIRIPAVGRARVVTPIRADLYDRAYRAALDARDDWPAMLGYAETLSHSPLPAHTSLARHIRTAYSLHIARVVQADPSHRDRSDLVDRWKEAALAAEAEETPLRIAMQHRDQWPQIVGWGVVGAVVLLVGTGWL